MIDYTLADLDGAQPALPIRHDGALVLLGPTAGGVCVACAEDTRLAALGTKVPRRDPRMRLGGLSSPTFQPLLDALIARMKVDPEHYRQTVVAVRTDLGTVSTHTVRTRPGGCPICGPLPLDSPAEATVVRGPVPAVPGTLRGANPLTAGDALRTTLFDLRHGPVAGVFRIGDLPLAVVSAEIVPDDGAQQAGYGRTADFADAERVALYESVERHSGLRPRRCTTVLEASFADLGPDRAVDPVRLGLPDQPSPHLTPYDPAVRTKWVHGWSYTREVPLAVPEHVAYWGIGHTTRFVDETSNGCGLGNSLTEAVLHGLFEVAERDAFLMAWYARTPLPRLGLPADPVLPHLVDRLEVLGYELLFFDATNDLGVPVVLSLARYLGSDPLTPRAFFAAGANPDPVAAMRSAAAEVAVDVEAAAKKDPVDRERLLEMLRAPESIRTMEDHVLVNGLPEAADRYAFLFDGDPAPVELATPPTDDLDALLGHYVDRLRALDLEVIAVDQTDPVVRDRLGLHSAKVIVPGTLPMTFGHLHRRTHGIPRLRRFGYDSLALQPHPFP
jgi:ribosomal protein S12 methylthiotransferase accessory factor